MQLCNILRFMYYYIISIMLHIKVKYMSNYVLYEVEYTGVMYKIL